MDFQQWSAEVSAKLGHAERAIARVLSENAGLREQHAKMMGAIDTMKTVSVKRSNNSALLRNVYAKAWGGEGYVSLDDIEGRLIPYDYLVDIPIPSGQSQEFQGTIPISMEGPFVATHRVMAYRSAVEFQLTDREGVKTSYLGRSNGRFRGISSAQDLFDAARAFDQISQYQPSYIGAVWDGAAVLPVGNPGGVNPDSLNTINMLPNFPGSGRPLNVSPMSMAASRTMGFDGLVAVELAGANFRRQNQPIPSDFWQEGVTGSTALSVYDVFDPGEVVTIKVTPTHVANPAYGSISSLARKAALYTFVPATGSAPNDPMPFGPFPFLEGQFDGHEGINDETLDGDDEDQADPAVRVFNGILTVGFRGFRILSPPSPPPKK